MLKFFCIPARQAAGAETKLNHLLKTQRILSVDRRWVDNGEYSYWSMCAEEPCRSVISHEPNSSGTAGRSAARRWPDGWQVSL